MKTKLIDKITNNEDYVRMRIFDGAFTPDNAFEELLRMEKEIRKTERLIYEDTIEKLINLLRTFSPVK